MNLDEIKQRAEAIVKLKAITPTELSWAADTILQLCTELERINKVNWQKWNDNECDEVLLKNEKLTAANKIMREQLNHTWPNVGFEIVNQHNEQAIAEADEVMK